MDDSTAMRRRFEDLLPWFVTGEIDPEDRAWVERYLSDHPDARTALQWHQALGRAVDDEAMMIPANIGWHGIAARLATESIVRTPARAGLAERLSDWFGQFVARPAYALAAALIVGQAAVIGWLVSEPSVERPEWSQTRGGIAQREPALQVRFRQSITEKELRSLLSETGARIVDGPDQLGDYVIVPRAGSRQELQEALRRSDLILSVEPFDWMAPAK